MRPLKLIMRGFMPYAGTEEINFEKFGENGLYLVTGDTGAGKTSIFDAICYALYGRPSGNVRDDSMFRSQYAKIEDPTEVELTFVHDGKKYYVKRNPGYQRLKKSGSGTTPESPKAYLELPDGSFLDRRDEVNSKIEEILGVDIKQFSQISMIAQGDFLKLILDGTKSRRENFRHLFNTDIYQNIQETLKKEKSRIETMWKDAKKSVEQYISGIECNEEDTLFVDVEKAKSSGINIEEVIELIDKLIEADESRKNVLTEGLKKIDEELAKANGDYGKAQAFEKNKQKCEEIRKTIEDKQREFEVIKNRLALAEKELSQKEQLSKAATAIELQLDDYKLLEELVVAIKEKIASLADCESELDALAKQIESDSAKLAEYETENSQLKNAGENIVKLGNDVEKCKHQKEGLDELKKGLEVLEDKCTHEKACLKEFCQKDEEYKKLREIYNGLDDIFRGAQAGILASTLEAGKACPVCGSTTHPLKAELVEECPTQDEVDKAKDAADEARAILDAANSALQVAKSDAKAYEERLLADAKKIVKVSGMDELASRIEDLINDTMEELRELTGQLKAEKIREARKIEIEKLIPELKDKLVETQNKQVKAKELSASLKAEVDSMVIQKEKAVSNLEYDNLEEAKAAQIALVSKVNEITENYNAAEKLYKSVNEVIKSKEGELKGLEQTLVDAPSYDLEEIIDTISSIESRQKECQNSITCIVSFINTNRKCKESIEAKAKELIEIEKEFSEISVLSDTANGQINGRMKLTLEAYIQATYFDRIIIKANRRLREMSGYKYELYRIQDKTDLSANSGLELGVIDHYNGTKRSVKSLSGGESFMASLSLALGLSDEVSESAGGIKVDTMFIDEGFGSLDQETLQKAYNALAKLADKSSNRLVGIISHVSELKEKIDKQIVVTKEKSGGSHTELIL